MVNPLPLSSCIIDSRMNLLDSYWMLLRYHQQLSLYDHPTKIEPHQKLHNYQERGYRLAAGLGLPTKRDSPHAAKLLSL